MLTEAKNNQSTSTIVVQNLLSLSRSESGRQTIDIATVALVDVVQTCISDHQETANLKHVRLCCNGDPRDLRVGAHEGAIAQIVSNLIDNAVKYTPNDGQGTGVMRREAVTAGIEVQDTETGVDTEHLARVLERF